MRSNLPTPRSNPTASGKRSRWLGALAVSVLALAGMTSPAMAAIRYVAGNNAGTDSGDCTDSANRCRTVKYAVDQATAGDMVSLGVGSYAFPTGSSSGHTNTGYYINKSVSLIGEGDAKGGVAVNRATLTAAPSTISNGRVIYVLNVANVRIENLYIELDYARTKEAVLAMGTINGLVVKDNYIESKNSSSSGSQRNAISINPVTSGDRSVAGAVNATYGQLSTVTGNVIFSTTSVLGARGILVEAGGGTISNNTIYGASTNDMRVRWNSGGSVLIENNSFGGRGVNVVEPSVGVTVRGNAFSSLATAVDNASSDASDYYQLRFDAASSPLVEGNTFSGYGRYFRAVYVERSSGAQFIGNTFTPKDSGTIYDSIAVLVENKSANSNSTVTYPPETHPTTQPKLLSATFLRNTFNGSGVANRGFAVGLLNSNDPNGNTATFGTIAFGSADPADANIFDGNLQWYIHLAERRCNTGTTTNPPGKCPTSNNMIYRNYGSYGGNSSTNTQAWPFRGNVAAFNNKFGGKFVAEMTPIEYLATAAKIQDKADAAALGIVNYESFTPITTGTIAFSPATFAYDGNAHTISATLQEDGSAACVVTPATVTALGSTAVSATCTNTFYNVTGAGSVEVTKGAGTVQLAQTSFTYTGAGIVLAPSMAQENDASCAATPATVTNAGAYSIHIACAGTNYDAEGDVEVTVGKAGTQIVLDPSAFAYDDSEHTLHAQLADEPGTTCTGVSPATVRTVGTHEVTVPACEGENYTAPAANLFATVGGSQTVHVVETEKYYASVAAALADAQTLAGYTLELAPGTYSGPILLTKGVHLTGSEGFTPARGGVQTHDASNAGTVSTPNVVIDGGNVLVDGITVANGVTGATISGLEIRNFTHRCIDVGNGTSGLTIHNNLIHHCGEHAVHVNGLGDIANVTLTNNEVHTFGGRGLVIWNGIKRDVTIQENYVHNEDGTGCCGIELQDGAATGAWVLDNRVENAGDSGMAFIQLTSGSPTSRINRIAGNEIANTGRFGIEIKIPNGSGADSGDGAIVVEDNLVTSNQAAANIRDRAGIAVIRNAYNPGAYPFQVDATDGVILRGNQVSGFTNANAGYEGYGIVVEGTGSSILNNTLSGNGIGLQVQQANAGNQDTLNSDWFGRGNAAASCVEEAAGNSFSGNGTDQRNVPATSPMIGKRVENLTTNVRYCSINAAIAAASEGDTLAVDAGIHAENVVVTRPVTILGAGQDQTILVPAVFNPDCDGAPLGTQGSMCDDGMASIVVHVKASNVTIADLTVDGINPNLAGHETDIAARNGIMSATSGGPYTDFVVEDTTVRNIWLRGIYSPNNNGTFQFVGNTVDNVQADPASIAIFNFYGSGLIEDNVVSNANDGIASNWSKGTTYRNNTVTSSGSGIHTDNNGGSGGVADLIENNTVDCDGVEDAYGVFVFANYATTTVRDNAIAGCAVGLGAFGGRTSGSPALTVSFTGNLLDGAGAVLSTPGDESLGMWLSTTTFHYGEHDNAVDLTGNTITGFGIGVLTDRGDGKSLTTNASLNRIVGNGSGWEDDGDGSDGDSDFQNNWWGCNAGPNGAGCDTATTSSGDFNPWLVLGVSATPQVIASGAPSDILVDLTTNSDGAVAGNAFLDGTAIGLTTSKGALVPGAPFGTLNGQVETQLQGHVSGFAHITASLDNAVAQTTVVVSGPVTVNEVAAVEFHADARATCDAPDFSSIQAAIDAMPAGSEILVCPGVYAEDVSIQKAVALLGPQVGVNAGVGGTRDGSDAANEAILVPGTQQPGMSLGSYGQSVIDIEHDDVRVDGFVIDGDNPVLDSDVDLNGADPDVSVGIYAYGNRIALTNLVVRNFVYAGINGYHDNIAPGASGGSDISRNRIANVTSPGAYGIGILLQNNFYADVTENLIDEARVGIQTNNTRVVAPNGFLPAISGNEVHAARAGLFHNLFTQTATRFAISGNSFIASDNPAAGNQWNGVQIESMGGVQQVVIVNNTIDGSALAGTGRLRVGYVLNNVTTTEDVSTRAIDGGVVSNVDIGVLSTDATNYTGEVNDFLVRNVAFSGIGVAALYVEDTIEQAGSARLTIGAGNSYALAPGAHKLALSGAAPFFGGVVDDVFVRSARGYLFGLPGSGPCASGCAVANASINGGIAVASVGGTVTVEGGTFGENVVVNKALSLVGPYAGVHGNDTGAGRGTNEAIVSPASGVGILLSAADVTVDGLTIGSGGGHAVQRAGGEDADNLSLINNRIVNVTNGSGVFSEPGSAGAGDGFLIARNLFGGIAGSGSSNGRGIVLFKGTSNAQVSDNDFTSPIQLYALQVNGGSGTVQNVAITDNRIAGTASNAVILTNTIGTSFERNTVAGVPQALYFSDKTVDLTVSCNVLSATGSGLSAGDQFGDAPNSNIRIFHNAISGGTFDLSSTMAQGLTIGSNWYDDAAPAINGSAVDLLVADPLLADPTNGGAFDVAGCGDNTPVEIVAYAGTSPQSADVDTAFDDLRARVQDVLGGAVMGEAVAFAAGTSGEGATATLGTLSGTSNYNGELTTTATANSIAGTYAVTASSGALAPDAEFALTNTQGTATVTVTDATVTYDTDPHAVAVTTVPGGLEGDVEIVYTQGMTTVATCAATATDCGPVDAGAYTATATIVGNPNYAGAGIGTLTIERAPTTIVFAPLSMAYDGNAHAVAAYLDAETGSDCPVIGSPVGPNAGGYLVSADACVGTNYEAPASGASVTITPQPTTITFTHLVQAFDGSPKLVVATTSPTAGVPLTITYDGSVTPPTAVDSYALHADVADANYSGSADATFQIVEGTGDIALVLNGPVDPVHVGEVAQYAATMLANPLLHEGETFGYKLVLSKTSGGALDVSDIATMEVFYANAWVDASELLTLFADDGLGNLVYQFPDGIPGYSNGFPIEDPSWTWNFRFTFATTGIYTTSAELVDGVSGDPVEPSVMASIATTVVDALPPTDIHLVLGGPAAPVEVGQWAEYTGTLIADPVLHVGERFFVKVTVGRNGGDMEEADLLGMQIYLGGGWVDGSALGVTFETDGDGNLVYLFPESLEPLGFEILDPVWAWNFRFQYAQADVYTAVAQVIPAADAHSPAPQVFATAAVSTTVVDATPHVPDLAMLLFGPLDPVELGSPAQYTGTMLAEPAQFVGRNFFVRIRLSKNGGADAMQASDLATMELFQGGSWQDATSVLLPYLLEDGNDLVYLFPRPAMDGGFPIQDAVWSWTFRFTYGDTGVFTAVADVVDVADIADPNDVADVSAAASLASAGISTTVIDTPQIAIDLQGPLSGIGVGDPAHYAATLSAGPLPAPSEQFIVRVRLGKNGGAAPMTVSDLTSAAISADGVTWTPAPEVLDEIYPDPDDSDYLLYDFPNPAMPSFPITGPWTWHFQFTYGSEGTYSAQATVLRFGTEEAVSNTAGIATLVGLGSANIAIDPASLYAVYDTAPHAAAVSVAPIGLAYTVTYEGIGPTSYGPSSVAPTDAGNYAVVASIDAGQGYAGSASGALTIVRAVGTVSFAGAANVVFDGLPHALTATLAEEPSATCTLTASGDHPRTVAGTTLLTAACNGANYIAHGSASLTVTPKPVTIALSGTGSFPYDGNPHAATAMVVGEVAGYPAVAEVTYDGGFTAPSAVGSYSVVAALDAASSVNYVAAPAVGLIVIGSANVTVTLGNLGPHVYDGSAKAASVVASPSVTVDVTYDGGPTPPSAAGSYTVVATVTQAGYSGSAAGTLVITRAASTVAFSSPLSGAYDTVHTVTATIAEEPATSCTVSGVPAQSAAVGSYTVSATCDGDNYTASGSTTYEVTPVAATISVNDATRQFNGAPQAVAATATPAVAHSVTYEGTGGTAYPLTTVAPGAVGTYTVTATITDPNYTAASDTATLAIVNGVVLTLGGDTVGAAHTDAATYSFFEADAYSAAAVESVVVMVTVSRQGGIDAGDVSLAYALNPILDPSGTFHAFALSACGADLCGVFDAGEPSGAFVLPPGSLPTTWRASSTRGGRYSVAAQVVGEASGVVYASATHTVDVADIRLSGIANLAGRVGEPVESSMTMSNVGTAALSSITIPGVVTAQPAPNNENVRGRFTIHWDGGALTPADTSGPGGNCGAAACASPDVGIEFFDADLGQYRSIYNLRQDGDGESLFGHFGALSGGGIPVWAGFNASTLFRTTFKQHTGTYTVVWQVVGIDSGKVYAEAAEQIVGIDEGEGAFIAVVSGDGGEATVGGNAYDLGDLIVEVRNIYNNPVPGAAVSFNVLPGANGAGAALSAPLPTDANGQTRVTALSNDFAGAFEVSATLSGGATLAHPFALANLADADPAQVRIVAVSGDGQTAQVGSGYSLPLVVKATDRFGNPLQGIEVGFQAPGAGASVTPASVVATTDANGLANSGALTANSVAGAVAVTVAADEDQCDAGSVDAACAVGFGLTNTAGGADSVTLVSSTASATVGTAGAYTLTATVSDEDGNVVPGVSVTLIGPSSGAGIAPAVFSDITDAAGQVVRAFDANTVAGAFQVQAVASGADAATVALENLADAAAKIVRVSGNGQSAAVNTAFADDLVVQVLDQYDNPVADDAATVVSFASVPNGSDAAAATVSATATSGVAGLAGTAAQANGTAGSYNVVASFNGHDVSFALQNTVGGVAISDIVWAANSAISIAYDGATKAATATVSGGYAATFTYNGSGTAPTSAGSYLVTATVDDGNVFGSTSAMLTITPAAAGNTGIVLTGGSFTYDGSAKPATVTNPNGVAYTLSYDTGNGLPPVNVGSYVATLAVTDPNHAAETLTADIDITPANATVAFANLSHVYDGTAKSATVTTTPAGVTGVSLSYSPDAAPTNAGSYTVTATLSNPNYVLSGATTAELVIAQATAQIFLSNLTQVYDGSVKSATVTTVPASLVGDVEVGYTPATPINVGSYAVTATLTGHPNYADASASGTLAIVAATIAGFEIVGDASFTGTAGAVLSPTLPTVRLFDTNNNGVAGIAVTFTPGADSGTVAQTTVTTDANGRASAMWTLAPDAGTDSLVASVGLPGLDPLAFTATSVEVADLAISKTSAQTEISFNELATYTLVVTNAGPSNAAQADILDELPDGLNAATATWLCAGSDGALCGVANGSGDVDVSASIPVGSSVTVTLSANVLPDAAIGPLVNEAFVELASGSDAQQGNNADDHAMQVVNREPDIFKDGFEDGSAPLAGVKSAVLAPAWERIGNTPALVAEALGESGKALARVEALQIGENRWFRLRWKDAEGVQQASDWSRLGAELELEMEADYLGIGAADSSSAMRLFVPDGDARLHGLRTGTASLR